MRTIKLIVLTGLPGSGKSTMAKHIQETGNGVVIIERDLLRRTYQAHTTNVSDVVGVIWPKWQWTNEDKVTMMYEGAIHVALSHPSTNTIVAADTNLTAVSRDSLVQRYTRQAKLLNIKLDVVYITVDTDLEECIARDSQRKYPVGEEVIRDMYSRFEPTKDIQK